MRKFRFIGNNSEAFGYGKKQPYSGTVYNENEVFLSRTVLEWAEDYDLGIYKEWQEVFEEPTLQDRIQELKDFAKGQGLKVDVVVEDVDIWEGVQYAECINTIHPECWSLGTIYKLRHSIKDGLLPITGDNGTIGNIVDFTEKYIKRGNSCFKPSTESAYVEQLKKEAFERFGEIKGGDRFDESTIDGYYQKVEIIDDPKFTYFKNLDILLIGECTLYRNGKWAKKLPKRVEVDPNSLDSISKAFDKCSDLETNKFKVFLAKQLEKYLNGEVE